MNGIPVLHAEGLSIAQAWENSLLELHAHGSCVKTQYDKSGDPPSKDATMLMTIQDPLSEPMIHRDIPGGFEDLEEYVMEVCDGIKDHLVRDPLDPTDTRWEYTYHQRLFRYESGQGSSSDQITTIVRKLSEVPFSRRAQAVTWKVWEDNDCYDPPCLQSVWCRILEENGIQFLNMNVRFRSNDAYKAAFMNIFALVRLQMMIAQRVSDATGREVRIGRYCHLADSYHLYGSYFAEFESRFLGAMKKRTFDQRTIRYEDVREVMQDARPRILEKVASMTKR